MWPKPISSVFKKVFKQSIRRMVADGMGITPKQRYTPKIKKPKQDSGGGYRTIDFNEEDMVQNLPEPLLKLKIHKNDQAYWYRTDNKNT